MTDLIDLFRDTEKIAIDAIDLPPLRYCELLRQIELAGSLLHSLDLLGDRRVAIVMPNGSHAAAAFVCFAPWTTVAPLNPAYTAEEFDFYLSDLEANAVLVECGSKSIARDVAKKRDIPVIELDCKNQAGAFDFHVELVDIERRIDAATALILHTSGTTSRPKMVPLSQRNLIASARNIASTLQLAESDRCLNVMPLFHIHGLMAPVLVSLASGASVVCTPGFDALKFYSWLEQTEPTWYSAVPTMHQAISTRAVRNTEIIRNTKLRFIRSSSASLPSQVLLKVEEIFDTRVVEAYAMTEAAHQMCSNPLPPNSRKPGMVGPAAGPDVNISEVQNLRFLAAGEEGEIVIRGENVTDGYLKNPDANAKDFVDGWFRTGDLGMKDEEGYIRVTGRLKEIINRGGEKIAPLEVDEVLLDHDSVAQACTFAVPHEKLGEEVSAIIVLNDGKTATARDIQSHVCERLAAFKVPRTVLFLDEIPKGPTGKVQRIGMAVKLGILSSE